MKIQFSCFIALLLLAFQLPAQAQVRSDNLQIDRLPDYLAPYLNSFQNLNQVGKGQENGINLDDKQKKILHRIAFIYRLEVLAIEAKLNNDPLSTEKHIADAISQMQDLINDYPNIQNSSQFNELYRTVMTEYREFYGVADPVNKVKGDIFAIHKEMFKESNDWAAEGYALPNNVSLNKEMEVPLVQNRQVSRHLIFYTLKRPEVMSAWIERSKKYFPMIERILKEEGVPEELKYLAMIESGLNPSARSWAAAAGMWQFIRATGSVYGLEVNWWVDERRDPEKATRAAARHLKDLYNIWDDWHLAMANYNVSPRRLKSAIRSAGGEKNYWSAYPYLPRETRGYVPGYIAATIVATNAEEFGFRSDYDNIKPYDYDLVEVDGLIKLDLLAEAGGITVSKLKEHNPELLRWATPPGEDYPLKLPVGTKEAFLENYENIPKSDRTSEIVVHQVSRGETLGRIAQKYGTSVRSLYENNENLSHIIHPGQKLMVPIAPGSMSKISANRPTNQPRGNVSNRSRKQKRRAPANTERVTYTVKTGDTIGHIAEWYDTLAWKIRSWNGIGNVIRVGQRLTVYVPKSKKDYYRQINSLSFSQKQSIERDQKAGEDVTKLTFASADNGNSSITTYTVQRNDTLIEIANLFNTSVDEIRNLNNLNGSRIYVGQNLKIREN
mgnify:CR=1 FL=1